MSVPALEEGHLAELRKVHDRTRALEDALEREGAPYTPGRMPVWPDRSAP